SRSGRGGLVEEAAGTEETAVRCSYWRRPGGAGATWDHTRLKTDGPARQLVRRNEGAGGERSGRGRAAAGGHDWTGDLVARCEDVAAQRDRSTRSRLEEIYLAPA